MQKELIIAIVVGALLLVVIAQSLQLNSLNANLAGLNSSRIGAPAQNNGVLDTTGWTANEKMNYEMHGTIPARINTGQQASAQSSVPTQVGGC